MSLSKQPGGEPAVMNPNKALWEKGDFTEIAGLMRESGTEVVRSLEIESPLRALDLGCGDGTTALPLARAGAEVVGIGIARNLDLRPGTGERPRKGLRTSVFKREMQATWKAWPTTRSI